MPGPSSGENWKEIEKSEVYPLDFICFAPHLTDA